MDNSVRCLGSLLVELQTDLFRFKEACVNVITARMGLERIRAPTEHQDVLHQLVDSVGNLGDSLVCHIYFGHDRHMVREHNSVTYTIIAFSRQCQRLTSITGRKAYNSFDMIRRNALDPNVHADEEYKYVANQSATYTFDLSTQLIVDPNTPLTVQIATAKGGRVLAAGYVPLKKLQHTASHHLEQFFSYRQMKVDPHFTPFIDLLIPLTSLNTRQAWGTFNVELNVSFLKV